MRKRKTKKLLWIIVFLTVLIITISVSYILGSQQKNKNSAKPTTITKTKKATSNSAINETNNRNNNSNSHVQTNNIPNQFWGTWYSGTEKFAIISANKFIMPSAGTTITKTSLPLQLCDTKGPNGTYDIYHNPDPNAIGAEGGDGNAYWIGNLTIDGKKERVLARYVRQGVFDIFTSHPTAKNQSIQYDVSDWDEQIGNPNLDFLKGKSRNDLDKNNKSFSEENSDKKPDSNNDFDKDNSENDQNDNKSDNNQTTSDIGDDN